MSVRTGGEYFIKIWVLPESKSALDRWSDRAYRIALIQLTLSIPLEGALFHPTNGPSSRIHYDEELGPTWKKVAGLFPILLSITCCIPRFYSKLRALLRLQETTDADIPSLNPTIYCISQTVLLLLCTLLTTYEFIHFSILPPFWIALVCWFSPAVVGFIYSLVGVHRFCLQNFLNSADGMVGGDVELYHDDVDESGHLEQMFRQQGHENNSLISEELDRNCSTLEHAHSVEPHSLLSPQQPALNHESTLNSLSPTEQSSSIPSRAPTRPYSSAYFDEPPVEASSHSNPEYRFRWQESEGVRNGGAIYWGPAMGAGSGLMICIRLAGRIRSDTWGLSRQAERQVSHPQSQ